MGFHQFKKAALLVQGDETEIKFHDVPCGAGNGIQQVQTEGEDDQQRIRAHTAPGDGGDTHAHRDDQESVKASAGDEVPEFRCPGAAKIPFLDTKIGLLPLLDHLIGVLKDAGLLCHSPFLGHALVVFDLPLIIEILCLIPPGLPGKGQTDDEDHRHIEGGGQEHRPGHGPGRDEQRGDPYQLGKDEANALYEGPKGVAFQNGAHPHVVDFLAQQVFHVDVLHMLHDVGVHTAKIGIIGHHTNELRIHAGGKPDGDHQQTQLHDWLHYVGISVRRT